MAGTPESKVRDPVVKWAKAHGIEHQRMSFARGVKRAFPDDCFLVPGGRPFFVEFKAPGEEPTALQTYRGCRLLELGYDVCWTDSTDAARTALILRVGAAAVHGAGQGSLGCASRWRLGP
jgi:hypothetical protein